MKNQVKQKIDSMMHDVNFFETPEKVEYVLDLYKLYELLSKDEPSADESIQEELDGARMYLALAEEATDEEIHSLRKQQAIDELEHAKINAYIHNKLRHSVKNYNHEFNELAQQIKAV